MKEKWTYKKLGEVGTIIGGSTPKTDVPEFWNGDFAWITPAELDGSKCVSSTIRTITEEAVKKTNLTLLPIGTVLLSSRAPIGKVCITKIPMYCNQGFKNIVCSDELNNEFLYWWLKGKSDFLNSLGVGATFKEISKRIVEQIVIPVPPIETQSRIVSELDLLQSIIDKQKAQLKELDNLAQAVFYDMFGDPVENDKGWEVKKLEEIVSDECPISYGIVQPGDGVENGIPVVRPVDMTHTFVYRQGLKQTTKEISNSYKRTILKGNEILLCVRGTTGLVSLATDELKGCNVTRGVAPIECNAQNDRRFVYFQFLTNAIQQYIAEYTKGIALKQINMKDVREIPFIVPPLSLQQSFAAKIESIEKQKAAITQSIAETQRLFDYTMDKYFG